MAVVTAEIVIILLLISINGVLAMSEIAVVSARKARLQHRADGGDAGAKAALELAEAPGKFLSTVQIGITLVGILVGAFGGATIASHLSDWIARFDLLAAYSETLSVLIVVAVITYLTLVLGELAPKRIGLSFADQIASRVALPMKGLSRLTAPLVRLLTRSTDAVLRIAHIPKASEPEVSDDEVRLLIQEGTSLGIFEPIEEEIVDQLFRLSDRTVASVITPRTEMVCIDINESTDAIRTLVIESGFSRYPVIDATSENVLGQIRIKDLMAFYLTSSEVDIERVMQPPLFVPESTAALDMLERFRKTQTKMALVIDEFGGVMGLLTLNDIVEEIVGDLPSLSESHDAEIVQRDDGSWLLDGMLPLADFEDLFDIEVADDIDGRYQTVGGLVMALLGHVPSTGDHCDWASHRIEVVDMDGRRVDKVLVVPPEEGDKVRG
jgi:putative hemolysin